MAQAGVSGNLKARLTETSKTPLAVGRFVSLPNTPGIVKCA